MVGGDGRDDGWEEIPVEWERSRGPEWRPVNPPPADAPGAPVPAPWTPGDENAGLPVGARKRRGTIGWDIMLGIDLAIVALSVVLSIAFYLVFVATGRDLSGGDADTASNPAFLFIGITFNLFLFGIIPLIWIGGTRVGGWEGVKAFLQLDKVHTAWWGLPLAGALAVAAVGVMLLLDQFGLVEETPNAEALAASMTWPLVFFVSFVAGTSEEILFRGVLQKWTGWVGQGLIFGLFHLANGVTGLVATALIGLLFGYLVKRGVSLWVVMVAHFAYDVILLSIAMLYSDWG